MKAKYIVSRYNVRTRVIQGSSNMTYGLLSINPTYTENPSRNIFMYLTFIVTEMAIQFGL